MHPLRQPEAARAPPPSAAGDAQAPRFGGDLGCRRQGLRMRGRRACFPHCRDSAAGPPGPDACRRPAGPQRSPRLASPVLPRPGPRGGLTSTTRDSLWTEGSPQPPPQQLSSMGAAILPGLTSVTRKYSYRPLSSTWNGGGRDEELGLTPWGFGQSEGTAAGL